MRIEKEHAAETLHDNYAELNGRRRDNDAILAGLWEMASSLLPETVTADDVLALYRTVNGERASHSDFAALCLAAAKARTAHFPEPEPDDEPEPPPHVLMMRGADAAEAAAILLSGSGLSASYGASAAEICETVAGGRAGFCILPMYSSTDGILTHFRRLAEEAELRIVSLCTVSSGTDGALIRYALLQRRGLQLDGRKRFLEIIVSAGDEKRLLDLPAALTVLGASPQRVFLLPPSSDGTENRYQFVLDVSASPLAALRLYFAGAFPEAEAVGYYDLK